MSRTLTTNEMDILRFAEMHGEYTCVGVVMVLAARKLAFEGRVTMVSDEADNDGIGRCKVGHKAAS